MNNLADVLTHQGKLKEAEKLQQGALKLSQKVRSPENPDTLSVMSNI